MVTRPFAQKRRVVYFGSGPTTVLRPYSKEGKLILGLGQKRKRKIKNKKTKGKQKGGWAQVAAIALPYALDLIKKRF